MFIGDLTGSPARMRHSDQGRCVFDECFVICPIGAEGSETRRISDRILDFLIEPALRAHGYTAVRADRISAAGVITEQIVQSLVTYPLVIADLSVPNPNVYYELGIRHLVGKPYIQIAQKGASLPFDVSTVRTLFVDITCDDKLVEGRKLLEEFIAKVGPDETYKSPATAAFKELLEELSRHQADEFLKELHLLRSQVEPLRTIIDHHIDKYERLKHAMLP